MSVGPGFSPYSTTTVLKIEVLFGQLLLPNDLEVIWRKELFKT